MVCLGAHLDSSCSEKSGTGPGEGAKIPPRDYTGLLRGLDAHAALYSVKRGAAPSGACNAERGANICLSVYREKVFLQPSKSKPFLNNFDSMPGKEKPHSAGDLRAGSCGALLLGCLLCPDYPSLSLNSSPRPIIKKGTIFSLTGFNLKNKKLSSLFALSRGVGAGAAAMASSSRRSGSRPPANRGPAPRRPGPGREKEKAVTRRQGQQRPKTCQLLLQLFNGASCSPSEPPHHTAGCRGTRATHTTPLAGAFDVQRPDKSLVPFLGQNDLVRPTADSPSP